MTTCPYCAEEIDHAVDVCPHCGSNVHAAPRRPAPPRDLGEDAGMRLLLPVGRSGWAIAAGYFGLFSLLLFPAPIALLLGVVAILDIKRNPDRRGMGRAVFGVVMGILGTGFLAIGLIAALIG